MYLQPLKHKLLRLCRLSHESLSEASVKSWVISPESTESIPPAIFDEHSLDRVTGAGSESTLDLEIQRLHSSTSRHAATRAFLLEDVDLVDGYLYGRRWYTRLLNVSAPISATAPEMHVAQGSLACTFYGNIYFGHWVTDDLMLHLTAEQTGDLFVVQREPYLHEHGYRELLNAPRRPFHRAHFDRMIIFDDIGENDHKRRRYQVLRSRLRSKVRSRGSERVFIRRGSTGDPRSIANAAELEEYLMSQGFVVVDPEHLTAGEIAARLMGARVVMSVEGSQPAHALLAMAEGGVLCCIQPPARLRNVIRGYAASLNIRYAIVVGHGAAHSFSVDLEDVRRILDRIDAVSPRSAAIS